MKYKCTDLIASWTCLYQQIVYNVSKANLPQRVTYSV